MIAARVAKCTGTIFFNGRSQQNTAIVVYNTGHKCDKFLLLLQLQNNKQFK